jgi:hypothetical protein
MAIGSSGSQTNSPSDLDQEDKVEVHQKFQIVAFDNLQYEAPKDKSIGHNI